MRNAKNADWAGKLELRWRWLKFSREWGRWCYKTDCCGETLAAWFEWEKP